jgi:hypothetical protein
MLESLSQKGSLNDFEWIGIQRSVVSGQFMVVNALLKKWG